MGALRIQTNPDGTLDEIAGPAVLEHMGGDVWNLVFWDAAAPRGAGQSVHLNILRMDAFEGADLPRVHREPCAECDRWKAAAQSMHRRAQAAEGIAERFRTWSLVLRDLTRARRDGRRLSRAGIRGLASRPLSPPTACSGPRRECACGDEFWPTRSDDDRCERCKPLEEIYR